MNKILIIEDEKDLVLTLRFRLEHNGYEVLTAYDGDEGLKKAQNSRPDLIILDLMLPKMDGYRICGILKSDERYKKIPVLILSARAQEADKKMGEEIGADAYVTKPFEPEELLDKIKELMKE
jgi:two-component system, OmpR family, alkaline phosphatase synthesis response regulator PhoP